MTQTKPDFNISTAIELGFLIPNFRILEIMIIAKAKEANASMVLYPSKNPVNSGLST
jgi:hypothetical protein